MIFQVSETGSGAKVPLPTGSTPRKFRPWGVWVVWPLPGRWSFRCSVWRVKQSPWRLISQCLDAKCDRCFNTSSRQSRCQDGIASHGCRVGACWKLRTARYWWQDCHVVLYLHANRFVFCLALCWRTSHTRGRVCSGRGGQFGSRNLGWVLVSSPNESSEPDPETGYIFELGELVRTRHAQRPAELDFWQGIQPELGGSDLTNQPAELDFWPSIQQELEGSDLAEQPAELDVWL